MEALTLEEIEMTLRKTADDLKRIRAQLGTVSTAPDRKQVRAEMAAIRRKARQEREGDVRLNPSFKTVWGPKGVSYVPRKRGDATPVQTLDEVYLKTRDGSG